MKRLFTIAFAAVMSVLLMIASDVLSTSRILNPSAVREATLIDQAVVRVNTTTTNVTKLYLEEELIGVVNDREELDAFLEDIYAQRYAADFPNTQLGLGADITMVTEASYFVYEDVDQAIFTFLADNDLFSVEVYKVKFSNGAIIYVKDQALFEEAKEQYLLNFIDSTAYELLRKKQPVPELSDYGTRDIGITVKETAEISKAMASTSEILKTKADIIYFLSYGYNPVLETYTTQTYDTIEYVAYNHNLTPLQLLSINADVLTSENQILLPGTTLNVSYFNSPLSVVVTKERFAQEIVYPPTTKYVKDASIREGLSVIKTNDKTGLKNVKYTETYINGILVSSNVSSEVITKQPIQEVILVGTKVIPHIGSGTLRWPINYPRILTCGWHCYYYNGRWHEGLDMKYSNSQTGPIYAADRGRVIESGFNSSLGYFVKINHNNGMITMYAHMRSRSWVIPGIVVNKGEQIGYIGSTGLSTGPHLHFGVNVNGNNVNPCKYLYC